MATTLENVEAPPPGTSATTIGLNKNKPRFFRFRPPPTNNKLNKPNNNDKNNKNINRSFEAKIAEITVAHQSVPNIFKISLIAQLMRIPIIF